MGFVSNRTNGKNNLFVCIYIYKHTNTRALGHRGLMLTILGVNAEKSCSCVWLFCQTIILTPTSIGKILEEFMSRMWGVSSDFPYPFTITPKQRIQDFSDVLVVQYGLFLSCLMADPNRWWWMCIRQSRLIQCRNRGGRKCILCCSTPIWWLNLGWKSISGAMR